MNIFLEKPEQFIFLHFVNNGQIQFSAFIPVVIETNQGKGDIIKSHLIIVSDIVILISVGVYGQ